MDEGPSECDDDDSLSDGSDKTLYDLSSSIANAMNTIYNDQHYVFPQNTRTIAANSDANKIINNKNNELVSKSLSVKKGVVSKSKVNKNGMSDSVKKVNSQILINTIINQENTKITNNINNTNTDNTCKNLNETMVNETVIPAEITNDSSNINCTSVNVRNNNNSTTETIHDMDISEPSTSSDNQMHSNVHNVNDNNMVFADHNIFNQLLHNTTGPEEDFNLIQKRKSRNNGANNTNHVSDIHQNQVKMPPIIIKSTPPNRHYIWELQKLCKTQMLSQYRGINNYLITTTSDEDYNTVLKKLNADEIQYFTYPKTGNTKKKIVAKVHIIILQPDQELNEIKSLNHIMGHKVTWERLIYNPHHVPQCYRCQKHGHTSPFCNMKFQCVKCTKEHAPGKCGKTAEDKPEWVNCFKDHPANYKLCETFQRYCARRGINNNNNNKGNLIPAPAPPPLTKSFSESLNRNNSPNLPNTNTTTNIMNTQNSSRQTPVSAKSHYPVQNSETNISSIFENINEIHELFTDSTVVKTLNVLLKLSKEIKKCNTDKEKQLLVFQCFMSLCI
ncbi:putative uncharacterized protein DDB_G0282133 [Ctenocephalides felis]|uniref:putative uncharacterized protein DDB_G0282133 n=1 Tax=Ctenocephalides felis TaxID=7515 RepID=UPI000E6E39A7|nr:putative uncharacterized protein DDB_G0282133 [Ctenocephalides felis]